MAAFLYRFAKVEDYSPPSTSAFSDVSTANLFYTEISRLAEKKIATGWHGNDGTAVFQPLSPVNRDATAAFMERLSRLIALD